jgi:protein-S-isoprenylcysteine O-methyltransferase Ste14
MMLAILRPDDWDFPLFLHVLGAIAVTGATAAAFAGAVAARRWPWLRGVVARTLLLVVFPAWVLMRVAGQWIDSKEDIRGDPGWLGVGYIVGDAGLVLLVVAMIAAAISVRRPERRWPNGTVAVITGVYLAALLVAMFAMSGKPGS